MCWVSTVNELRWCSHRNLPERVTAQDKCHCKVSIINHRAKWRVGLSDTECQQTRPAQQRASEGFLSWLVHCQRLCEVYRKSPGFSTQTEGHEPSHRGETILLFKIVRAFLVFDLLRLFFSPCILTLAEGKLCQKLFCGIKGIQPWSNQTTGLTLQVGTWQLSEPSATLECKWTE